MHYINDSDVTYTSFAYIYTLFRSKNIYACYLKYAPERYTLIFSPYIAEDGVISYTKGAKN